MTNKLKIENINEIFGTNVQNRIKKCISILRKKLSSKHHHFQPICDWDHSDDF